MASGLGASSLARSSDHWARIRRKVLPESPHEMTLSLLLADSCFLINVGCRAWSVVVSQDGPIQTPCAPRQRRQQYASPWPLRRPQVQVCRPPHQRSEVPMRRCLLVPWVRRNHDPVRLGYQHFYRVPVANAASFPTRRSLSCRPLGPAPRSPEARQCRQRRNLGLKQGLLQFPLAPIIQSGQIGCACPVPSR